MIWNSITIQQNIIFCCHFDTLIFTIIHTHFLVVRLSTKIVIKHLFISQSHFYANYLCLGSSKDLYENFVFWDVFIVQIVTLFIVDCLDEQMRMIFSYWMCQTGKYANHWDYTITHIRKTKTYTMSHCSNIIVVVTLIVISSSILRFLFLYHIYK